MRKRIALLAAQPEEGWQNEFIQGYIRRAFSDNCDVCIFAMYQKYQVTRIREQGEAKIYSLLRPEMFDTIVVLGGTIQTPGVLEKIEEKLHSQYAGEVIYVDNDSDYFRSVAAQCPADASAPAAVNVPDVFDFNVGTMEDDLLMQTELSGVINIIFSYIRKIRPFESFHLCLNEAWSNDNSKGIENCTDYSDKMLLALKCSKSGKVAERMGLTAKFEREKLLPELWVESDLPRAFFFTPLFFEEHCFGYAAVGYGETAGCYNAAYKRWLSTVMHGLECYLRVNTLSTKNVQLETEQVRDTLTGLYNYKGFLKAVGGMLKDMAGIGGCVDIAAIELCGLNDIYMQLGSSDGDKVVNDFAQIFSGIKTNEVIGYMGSGEFLIALVSPSGRRDKMERTMDSVRAELELYCQGNGLDGRLELASGVMQESADGEEKLGSLVGEAVSRKNADKIRKQRQLQSGLTEDETRKEGLVADILDNNRLFYYFQPIVDSEAGNIYAYEALMRADTEEYVSPLEILKYAEHMGRLCDVEKATFLNVLSYVEAHEEQFENKKIFINSIPGTQMPDEYAGLIREKLRKFKGKIVVELTEQAELGDDELEAIKKKYEKLGVDTAVDDYGTGYSNVYNLLRYMPDFVKIDRMVLADIQLSAQKQHFVKEIVEFAHNNQITVLAEGVETPEELKMLTSLGVDLIQGYYTARPKAEVVNKIDRKVQNEIVQYNQYALEKSEQKVYRAGQDSSISLVKLAAGHYAKIRFTKEQAPHRDVSIGGILGFLANVEIEIEDGYAGTITLTDVNFAVLNEQPVIRLGKHCDVTLVLSGENISEQGGILVPEGSKLTVRGEGSLRIKQIAINGYGIGNDKDSRCGELVFEQDGLITVGGNTVYGVGIGAGYGGDIQIRRGRYAIQLAGEAAVGIGSLYENVRLAIEYCAIDLNITNSINVGIGSIGGNAKIRLLNASVKGVFNAHKCVGIGTLDGAAADYKMEDATVEITARARRMCAVGNMKGRARISTVNFSLKITAEGKEAIAMGNFDKAAEIHTQNGDLITHVKNELDFDIGAEKFEMINGYSEFILNDKEIVRKSIEGEM